MILLTEILKSMLLEISNDTVLYHRSFKKYNVGDVISPNESATGHYGNLSDMEVYMEAYRQEFHPEAPPRGKCIYCSVVPNSAFYGKGIIYEVKPRGKFLVTLASLINLAAREWERSERRNGDDRRSRIDFDTDEDYKQYKKDLAEDIWYGAQYELKKIFEWYWSGKNVNGAFKKDSKWIEVLCESVEVVGVRGEDSFKYLKQNDHVKLRRDITIDSFGRVLSNPTRWTKEEAEEIVKKYGGTVENNYGSISIKGMTIPKGTELQVVSSVINQSKFKSSDIGQQPMNNYLDVYRRLVMVPIDDDIFVDIRSVLWNLNYGKRHMTKTEDIFEKL